MTVSGDEHELLMRHTEQWAATKGRSLDRAALSTALRLRADHDELAATYWPAASVEHLLLVRWPAHGPIEVPAPDTLLTTLETFWRFLRATGRLAHGSAQPAELVRQARRVVPRMAQACADPARHGSAKVLLDFGRSIGIDLDGAETVEQLRERMDELTSAWNALPDSERHRLMPAGAAPAAPAPTGRGSALSGPVGMGAGAHRPDGRRGSRVPRGELRAAEEQARVAPFTRACVELAGWVGDGRAVTATGVLRLADARAAYAALRLGPWLARWRTAVLGDHAARLAAAGADPDLVARLTAPGPDPDRASDQEPDAGPDWLWRSARDCLALDRLWWSVVAAELVEVGRTTARATGRPAPEESWLAVGIGLVLGLCQRWPEWFGWSFLGLLTLCALAPQGPAPLVMLRAWWSDHHADLAPVRGLSTVDSVSEAIAQADLDELLADFADTGLWVRHTGLSGDPTDDALQLTDFGLEFTAVFGAALENGWLADVDG